MDIEQKARELLAAEYVAQGKPNIADMLRNGRNVDAGDSFALRAIAAALRFAQVPEWQPIETLPTNRMALLWFNDEQAMAMGHKTDRCRGPNSVVIDGVAAFADAWHPLPAEPQAEPMVEPELIEIPLPDDEAGRMVEIIDSLVSHMEQAIFNDILQRKSTNMKKNTDTNDAQDDDTLVKLHALILDGKYVEAERLCDRLIYAFNSLVEPKK